MLIFARKVTYMYRGALTKFVFANSYKYLFCVRIMNAFYNAREREKQLLPKLTHYTRQFYTSKYRLHN